MTAKLTDYLENADSVSQGNGTFTLQNGKASSLYYLLENDAFGPVATSDVYAAITQIMGSVSTETGDGRLQRSLPLAHPLYGWLFASGVSIQGAGQAYKFPGVTGTEATPFPNMSAWPNYLFHVEFTPRPYVLATNDTIQLNSTTFYDETGTKRTATVAAEWMRYTDWWYERKFESITCRQGQMVFKSNGVNPLPAPSKLDGASYPDMPRLFMPDSTLKRLLNN